jgi:hypothetical protein
LIDKYGKPLIDRIRKAVGLGSTKTSKGLQEAIKDFLPEVQLILRKELGEDVGGGLSRLINDKNVSVIEGSWAIQSKRAGSYLKMQDLLTFVNAYKKGTMTADQIEMYLPNYTIDGKEFRRPFMDILKSIKSSGRTLSKKLEEYKELFMNRGWVQVHDQVGNLSGWKMHVFSDNLDDAIYLMDKLDPVMKKWGAGLKIGGGKIFERSVGQPGTLQYGKGTTIYIPSSVFEKGAFKSFLKDVETAISSYDKTGTINGDRMISNKIGYRYELSEIIDPAKGVNMTDYSIMYNKNTGTDYKLRGMKDIFE